MIFSLILSTFVVAPSADSEAYFMDRCSGVNRLNHGAMRLLVASETRTETTARNIAISAQRERSEGRETYNMLKRERECMNM